MRPPGIEHPAGQRQGNIRRSFTEYSYRIKLSEWAGAESCVAPQVVGLGRQESLC